MFRNYLSLVKFSHTIFAMPFALIGYTLGEYQTPGIDYWMLVKVLLCMVFARNAAMAYNRYLDRDIDALNPRTNSREIPAGILRPGSVLFFVLVNCVFFIITCFFINWICLFLSPVALLVILGYSYTKRFTSLCHFVLGLGLALAPLGAYLAVTGRFALIPVLLSVVVMTWVAGFDIIYSLQDDQFDKSQQLHSLPTILGRKKALYLSTMVHVVTAITLCAAVYLINMQYLPTGILMYIGTGIFLSMLLYQHLIITAEDLKRVNLAFMTTNGIASVVFGSLVVLDFIL